MTTATPSQTGLTVLIPCFNEAAGVRRVHTEVTAALTGIDRLELLFIDDGSTDDTLSQLRTLAATDPRVRYLSLSRNGGLEAAQSAGFRYASQPWTAQLDADLQFPPSEIPRLLERAGQGYEVVFGIRPHRSDAAWRRWGSKGQQWLAQRGFGIALPGGASTFRVVRTAIARTISELGQGSPYFLATVGAMGLRYATVPVEHQPRQQGRSRFRITKLFGHSFELLFGHSWRPLNGAYLLSALAVAAAVLLAGLAALGLASPTALGVGATVLAALTLATVALLARYLHRLMRDLQPGRRYYLREANVPIRPEDRLDGGEEPVAPPQLRAPAGPLLVLGASDDQLPVYREAQRRGVPTIAVDRRSDLPALRLATEHLAVSIRDPAAIAAALGERRPAAVLAAGGELGVSSWHELSVRYQTPYQPPASAARASTDKAAFHILAAEAGVNSYRWDHDTDLAALAERADAIGYPLVAKPADGSGKRGVVLVREPGALATALSSAAAASFTGDVIIEQQLTGRDLTVDAFLTGGEVRFAAVHEKLTEPGDGFRVRGHVSPAPLDPSHTQALIQAATRLCQAIGLTEGPVDFDVFLAPDGDIQVVEVNARLPGEAVPAFLREVYQVDLVAGLVSLALGEPVDLTPSAPPAGAGILHMLASPLPTPGTFQEVRGVEKALAMPGIARCEIYAEPGATVPPFPQLGHEVGYVIAVGDDLSAARAALAAAQQVLEIDIQEGETRVP